MNALWDALIHNLKAHADIFIWFLPLAIVFYVVLRLLKGKEGRFWLLCLSLTCAGIIVMTLVGRQMGEPMFAWRPFGSYMDIFKSGSAEMALQCVFNIGMFIPLGFLLPKCFETLRRKRYTVLIAMGSSLLIEVIQGALGMGLFEIDDVMNNSIGAVIGVGIYVKICMKSIKK